MYAVEVGLWFVLAVFAGGFRARRNVLITFSVRNSNITQWERTGFTRATHVHVHYNNRFHEVLWQFFLIENRII
jgi:hypothetical protein